MTAPNLNWIANYIWGIADDVLRDVYVRGKYRDVILPMTVLRRLDAVLEPTKQAVLDMKEALDAAGVANQDAALRQAAEQAFHNTSKFTLRDLRARKQQLRADFVDYLDGFSINLSPSGLDNHGMGTVFEELIRRFNEENNEEAGEHFTLGDGRDAIGEARIPALRRPDRVRHQLALRRGLRDRRHAGRCCTEQNSVGCRSRQGIT